MSTFAEFARYYDLFYSDKDYAAESRFVKDVLTSHGTNIKTILELGCGTGRHATQLAEMGYAITGIDRSPEMVARARLAAATIPSNSAGSFSPMEGDVTRLGNVGTYDAVLSLFHVINYQTTNNALTGMFESARRALRKDGVFLFDFWYGPAVLADRPTPRLRHANSGNEKVTRIADPVLDINRNTVDVNYTLIVFDESRQTLREYRETHVMRYLFLPEIELLAQNTGFELLDSGVWMTKEPLTERNWLGWVVLRAT